MMKNVMLVILSLSLSMATAAICQGQNSSQSGSQASQGNQNNGNQTQAGTSSSQNMSATVSHDGKSITNDKSDKTYKVDNPDALQGREGQHVALIVHFDPETNTMHIIQVEAPPQQ